MKHFRVITYPLSYRITEPIMNASFQEMGFEGKYDSKEVSEEGLEEEINKLKSGELYGISLFTPHKGPALEFCDEISDEAKHIGAVNYIQKKGEKLIAYNLDWEGAMRAIRQKMPDISGKNMLVLGAGAAGRAVAYFAREEGANVILWNRTPEKAKSYAERISIDWIEDLTYLKSSPQIIVNATRLSCQDRQQSLLPFILWEKVELAMESVCRSTSLFLEEARAMNVQYLIEGEDWARHQMNALLRHILDREMEESLMQNIIHEVLR